MSITLRHYSDPIGIDLYENAELKVERDDDIIRIDGGVIGDRDDDYPLGRPGISVEMSFTEADELIAAIRLAMTPPQHICGPYPYLFTGDCPACREMEEHA